MSKLETFKIKVRDYFIKYSRQSKNYAKYRIKLIEGRLYDKKNLTLFRLFE